MTDVFVSQLLEQNFEKLTLIRLTRKGQIYEKSHENISIRRGILRHQYMGTLEGLGRFLVMGSLGTLGTLGAFQHACLCYSSLSTTLPSEKDKKIEMSFDLY